ncbi:MAG: DNA repair ATPase [Adhaeribacter sp.]
MEATTITPDTPAPEQVQLEGGTYEILRNRLQQQGADLRGLLEQLNQERKAVFGAIDTALITTARITTENNCVAWDMVSIGSSLLFGYNVYVGLKSEVELSDVFALYTYQDHGFQQQSLDMLQQPAFLEDFHKLYKYYKNTQFVKFAAIGNYLYLVFRVGKGANDIKTFKWLLQGDTLTYVDNRSDHEYVFPNQHDFTWKRPAREAHRKGKYPHVSIEDKVFVETMHGDLTIKVEDNTDSGQGIYAEAVEDKDQTLDDSEIYYAILGNLILLRIRPYRETAYRYLVYNAKLQEVRRIDALEHSCVLLPDGQGIIYAYGYYLQTGAFKQFDNDLSDMLFEKRIASPNGEDFLYVFFNKTQGIYLLLSYNLITQQIKTPVVCHGYALYENGELCYFKADEEAQKHHAIQIWQTPFIGPNFVIPVSQESYLYKIGNKDLVRAMAEANEVLALLQKGDTYANLYLDLIRKTTAVLDAYHWLGSGEAFNLAAPLAAIRQTASSAVAEYEKVLSIKKNTREQVSQVLALADGLLQTRKNRKPETIIAYVDLVAQLRTLRGNLISLKELRYADLDTIDRYENQLQEETAATAQGAVDFLLQPGALAPYEKKVKDITAALATITRVVEADATEKEIAAVAAELEMLIEVLSTLRIEDATQTTRIIDAISGVYASFNQTRASLRRKRQELQGQEGKAEFNAQIKLISQGVLNYLEVSDTPQKCEEYLAKLMVQLEELEGRFPDFEDFLDQLSLKREEIYSAFEAKKLQLQEARQKRAIGLQQAADRMLKAVQNRVAKLSSPAEINGYFAADLMIEKVRSTVEELVNMGDPVKADTIQSRLKTLKEDALRQLKDKEELFVGGAGTLRFGPHLFTVNTQPLELSVVPREGSMYFHLTGTGFFEAIEDEQFLAYHPVWEQALLSENQQVYRAEYLAFTILQEAANPPAPSEVDLQPLALAELSKLTPAELAGYVSKVMAQRFNEGYLKGVHDHDAALILGALLRLTNTAGLLRFSPADRAAASLYWSVFAPEDKKETLSHQLRGIGAILQVFPETHEFDQVKADLQAEIRDFRQQTGLCREADPVQAAEYLFLELTRGVSFVIDGQAAQLYEGFRHFLTEKKALEAYEHSVQALDDRAVPRFELIGHWLKAYLVHSGQQARLEFVDEVAALLLTGAYQPHLVVHTQLQEDLGAMQGSHQVVHNQVYQLHYHQFMRRLHAYSATTVQQFKAFLELKKQRLRLFEEDLRLNEFKPRVLSSFVRNKLIDQVYLPLIGANLAKQIGTAGEGKRTDLMGLLLLLSPPGYGKTTLMEYIANRLGIIFLKINGPAIGHQVTALDPEEAPNAAAREELLKLNLAFEMGDNVMIYLDDIQHCNPELLQKFISLCDAQRKIEGVYKGKSKTYDFRGKKVCVVMAGNPYTETGEKFRLPDMLANRADIYNLGDIIGDTEEAFKLSYIENALTSNPVLARLAAKSQKDIYPLVTLAQTGSSEGLSWEASHSPEELQEYVSVLKKLLRIQDVILKVNQEYIRSAAQSEDYRTEPDFKLQGSYRNMNKLAEKILPIMNEEELQTLILSHYEAESQTLTSGAEANMLRFKELLGLLTETEARRWEDIKAILVRNNKLRSFGGGNQAGQVLTQMENISEGLAGIREVLGQFKPASLQEEQL